jgi:hypothetical protein
MMSSMMWARLILSPAMLLWPVVWRCAVESLSTVVVPDEWSIVLTSHCSHTIAEL